MNFTNSPRSSTQRLFQIFQSKFYSSTHIYKINKKNLDNRLQRMRTQLEENNDFFSSDVFSVASMISCKKNLDHKILVHKKQLSIPMYPWPLNYQYT